MAARGGRWIRATLGVLLVLAFILAGLGLAATRGMPPEESPAWLTAAPIAHRGDWTASSERPENSLAAFESALDASLAIELDVHLTADGSVVVVHDDELERMTGSPGRVSELTLAQVQERRLLGGDEQVPTLAETLDLVAGRVPLLVELKTPSNVGPLEDAVALELRDYPGPVAVMAFNPFALDHMADVAPQLARGQLSGSFDGEDLAWYEVFLLRNLLLNWRSEPHFVAMEMDVVPSTATTVQDWWGRPLLCWTAEDAEDLRRAEGQCDGVIGNPGSR